MEPNDIGKKNNDFYGELDQEKSRGNFSCLTMIAIFTAIIILLLLAFSYFYLGK